MPIYNKITVNDEVIIDLTQDTITKEKVPSGLTFHDKSGAVQTGTMADNGIISQTMDGINTTSVAIPSGYTSGGMISLDNTIDNEVDEQTDLIAQIATAVDRLPEAGEVTVSVATCTIELINQSGHECRIGYTIVENGELTGKFRIVAPSESVTLDNCLCHSIIVIYSHGAVESSKLLSLGLLYSTFTEVFANTASENETFTINLYGQGSSN